MITLIRTGIYFFSIFAVTKKQINAEAKPLGNNSFFFFERGNNSFSLTAWS